MPIELPKSYVPHSVEETIYNFWLEKDLFHSVPDTNKKPFTIVIPPPNITGSLHMGHALNNTLQDAIIRYKRLCGFNTCWVPGTDHGGIATQNVVEKILLSEGRNKNELGREKFLEKMWKWKEESGGLILNQLKKLGCALDWKRTRFTMDEVCSRAVLEAFVRLYKKGLIYRGKRLVNWCPRCMTALSDIEVEHEEEIGKLWHIKYPLKIELAGKSPKDFIVVATTRPETMLGDTAVAVHPEDKRYQNLVGMKIILPLVNREIPIIADTSVDMTFGTGAVKVTPAHDPNDFEIGERHTLERVVVIDFNGKMTTCAGKYAGLDRYQARKEVLKDLEKMGFLLETVEHPHSVGVCYRCNTTIEPLISEQWFLNVREMSHRAIEAARRGELRFYPSNWEKQYICWLENLKDWCISRQIWWGHRIPVWYCIKQDAREQKSEDTEQKTQNRRQKSAVGLQSSVQSNCPPIVAVEKPQECPHCGSKKIQQESDVLDTWFSSALWPFSVFGWPLKTKDKEPVSPLSPLISDLSYYYPTSVLVTGHEILYLWVARMVQFGVEFMGKVPFKDVYIHGIVRDKYGKKMSKSLGNVIDPLEIMKKYGTDALRFSLILSATAGRDIQLSEDSFIGARNFANKIYNAGRFILLSLSNCQIDDLEVLDSELEQTDKWILYELNKTISETVKHFDRYELDKVARSLYEFIWTKFCDWYIEFSKIRLYGEDKNSRLVAMKVLLKVFIDILKMLHPIMPFITESLWRSLRFGSNVLESCLPESVMLSEYPSLRTFSEHFLKSSENVNALIEFISKVRSIREEIKIPYTKEITITVKSLNSKIFYEEVVQFKNIIQRLAGVSEINTWRVDPSKSAYAVMKNHEIFIPLEGVVDIGKLKERLNSEIEKLSRFASSLKARLDNKDFIEKAPQFEVENTKNKLKETEEKIEKLQQNLKYIL